MKRILIAEDDPVTRKILSTVLSGNYEIIEAVNGEEALEHAGSVDLILCDLNMPKVNGLEVFEKMPNKEIPFVMLTVEGDEEKKAIGKDIGLSGWITKPFAPNFILERVEKIFENKNK
ncbi:MAG: response regulator [Leptospirales bacterium]